ncbi:MAG TPA: hypothetical protein DIC42_01765 [Holosporales bacterium]|nr:hypothetical protein [Holosporales bacterium]
MHLHNVAKFKSHHFLFLLISAGCTLNGATESPYDDGVTQPPSLYTSKVDLFDQRGEDGTSSVSSHQSQGASPPLASSSVQTTPMLSPSPIPEGVSVIALPKEERGSDEAEMDDQKTTAKLLHKLSPITKRVINVFVYNDDGVMPQTVALWEQAFAFIEGNFMLSFIKAGTILSGHLNTERCDLFIMPGGRATPFHEKLGVTGKANIKIFADNGGKCLGVGAGAYFLSSRSKFILPGGNSIERDGVGLAQTEAYGPFSPIQSQKTKFTNGGSAFQVRYVQETYREESFVFCNGGCFFENHEATVIAATELGEAVVIREANNIILSGVHPEFSPQWIPGASPFHRNALTQNSRDLLSRILRAFSFN